MGVSNKVNDYLSVLRLEPPNRECGVWAEDAKRSPPDRCLDSFSGFAFCPSNSVWRTPAVSARKAIDRDSLTVP